MRIQNKHLLSKAMFGTSPKCCNRRDENLEQLIGNAITIILLIILS